MIKKRYIILGSILLMIILGSVVAFTKPVLPVIQLPGELYPGINIPILGGITNTFAATLFTYLIVIALVLAAGARSRTADEVPDGWYNLFEMVIEGAYNFAEGIAGPRVRDFFPWFFSFLLVILIANWTELVPGVDSIGIWENLPHLHAVEQFEEEYAGQELSHEEEEAIIHDIEEELDAENIGDLRVPAESFFGLLVRADGNVEGNEGVLGMSVDPDRADWTIVPFFRAPSTDLNFTLAMALLSMVMVQYYGFKYLGLSYLKKFFTLPIDAIAKNPIRALDPAVGILEFVSELAKVLSFSFRLLGNIFAGQILLFVMAFLLPVADVAFFGLELFVGFIQAVVFAMLTLVFMAGAAEHHGPEEAH
ncbi:MAG: F0F1 ATP synthase subunit A [Candidatus Promineifilaceae bacterium]|nr:F0F1 ATP synthase subunit A [Candidatus Promineifilaceae bacterium]